MRRPFLVCCALLVLFLPGRLFAQEPAPLDTSQVYVLDQLVVTADRSASLLASSTAAVSVVPGAAVRALPARSLADVLAQTPGFAFLNLDGLGFEPQETVRGFYGGGEAAYVVVLVDGRPLNNLEGGLVNWNQLPLAGIESVEIMRGGASSLYGDAALGGVVNVRTKPGAERPSRLTVAGGTYGSWTGTAVVHGAWGTRPLSAYGDLARTDGFRAHAGRTQGSAGASAGLIHTPGRSLTLSTHLHARRFDVPGPLRADQVAVDRAQGAPFFRFDETDEQTYRLSLDGTAALGAAAEVTGFLTGERREADVVRTLPLSADFADTQERLVEATRVLGSVQLRLEPPGLPFENRLVVGMDASRGHLGSRYFAIASGGLADGYAGASGMRGDEVAAGDGRRTVVAAFVQYDLHPASRVRLSAGARLDWLRDVYEPRLPAAADDLDATHRAFSPRAGLSVRWLQTDRQVGHVYANISRSFKAATPDQLFDQRALPVPFPPFRVTISNPDLEPQRGTSLEGGLYHRADLVPSVLAAEGSLAVYQIDMVNELDFSFETFRNVNIGKSRHRGVEAGVTLYLGAAATAFVNYTRQDVTFSNGPNEGNAVKAIPRDVVQAGLRAQHPVGLSGSLTLHNARQIFLDDANTIRLPGYRTVDARAAQQVDRFQVFLDVFNLFDAAYSSTGFPDPAGSDVVFFYPAAGRSLRFGLGVTL